MHDKVWIKQNIDQTWKTGTLIEHTDPLSYRTENNTHNYAYYLCEQEIKQTKIPEQVIPSTSVKQVI